MGKKNVKTNLRKKMFVFVSQCESTVRGDRWSRHAIGTGNTGHTTSSEGKQTDQHCCTSCFFFMQPGNPTHEMVPPTFQAGHLTSINPVKKLPLQMCVEMSFFCDHRSHQVQWSIQASQKDDNISTGNFQRKVVFSFLLNPWTLINHISEIQVTSWLLNDDHIFSLTCGRPCQHSWKS